MRIRSAIALPLIPVVLLKAGLCAFIFSAMPLKADVPPCHKSQKQEQCLDCCKIQPGLEVESFALPQTAFSFVSVLIPSFRAREIVSASYFHEDRGKTYIRIRTLLI